MLLTKLSHSAKRIIPYLGPVFFLLALFIIFNELRHVTLSDFQRALSKTSIIVLLLTFLLTVFNYLTLAGYDLLALYYLKRKVPLVQAVFAAMVGFAVSNNTGHALVTGPAVRFRFYKKWGVPGADLVKLSVFNSCMYLLGAMTLAPLAYFLLPHPSDMQSPMFHLIEFVMFACIASVLGYWALVAFRNKPFSFKGISIALPKPGMTLVQTVVAGFDLVMASLILFLFVNQITSMPFATFLVVFLVAQAVGIYSQVPGGVGVFEGVFLYMVDDSIASHELFIGLILFRVVYYIIPLILAGFSMLCFEFGHRAESQQKP